MIDISKLTESDKGRSVRYQNIGITEWGHITSWNERFVFVRYHTKQFSNQQKIARRGKTAEATDPRDLEFSE